MKRILLGVLLFGLLELALLVKSGQLFGTFFPILYVVLTMAAGGLLIRHYGLRTAARVSESLRTGRPPTGPPSAGMAGVLAGFLLILPGFLSDLGAILLLIPAARRMAASSLGWRMAVSATRSGHARRRNGGPIIDGEAVEIHQEIETRPAERASPWQR